jgi:hypothetical protein
MVWWGRREEFKCLALTALCFRYPWDRTCRTLDETSCSAEVGNGCVNITNTEIEQGYCVFRLCATRATQSGTVLLSGNT